MRHCACSNAATCAYVCVSVSRLLANWPLSYPALLPTPQGLEPPRGPSKRLVETLKCNFPPHPVRGGGVHTDLGIKSSPACGESLINQQITPQTPNSTRTHSATFPVLNPLPCPLPDPGNRPYGRKWKIAPVCPGSLPLTIPVFLPVEGVTGRV